MYLLLSPARFTCRSPKTPIGRRPVTATSSLGESEKLLADVVNQVSLQTTALPPIPQITDRSHPSPSTTAGMVKMNQAAAHTAGGEHIVARLRNRIREVRALGFHVRQEVLGSHQPGWCEIGGKKMLFIDASQTAREQLASIDDALALYVPASGATPLTDCDTS